MRTSTRRRFPRIVIGLLLVSLVACGSPPIPPPTQAPSLLPSPTAQIPPQASPTLTPSTVPTQTSAPPVPPTSTPTLTPIPALQGALQPGSPPPRHIILLIADSLRPDHTTPYGYTRPTTPHLDALVAQPGVRFENAITIAPWTCPSVAGLMTGRRPSSLGVTYRKYNPSLPPVALTLSEYLQGAGYYTAGFATTYCVKARLGLSQGFDYYDDVLTDKGSADKARAEEVNQRVLDWLQASWVSQEASPKPLFLFVYYFDPHVWYDPLPPYDTLYDSDYTGALTGEAFGVGKDVISGKIVPDERDIAHLKALYDGEITYWDDQLGRLLGSLDEMGLMEDTLLIVTADHGELFGEHGKWAHGNAVYQELSRVPFLMRYTGVIPAGTVVDSPIQSMDLTPTILDWAGVRQTSFFHAASIRDLAEGTAQRPERAVFSELDGFIDEDHPLAYVLPPYSMYAIQQGGWKLIHYPDHPELDELYQLQAASPYETDNLIQSQAEHARGLLQELLDWFSIPG